MRRVVIVGLGLIGGSIAKGLRRSLPGLEIVGIDRESVVCSDLAKPLLTEAVALESLNSGSVLAGDADLVVLAMPVGEIIACIRDWLRTEVPVTDCGSTKGAIVDAAQTSPHRDWFLPGHPMAGRERGGLSSATPDLFSGRRWIVCPQSAREETQLATRTLVSHLAAIWTEMAPAEHDATVALTSHLPQILASWLAASATDLTWTAAGPAFAEMTRVAGGSEAMWKDIFRTNAGAIAEIVEMAVGDLAAIARGLRRVPPNLDLALELLAQARAKNEGASNR
jgi:prephenate dehydrogenase